MAITWAMIILISGTLSRWTVPIETFVDHTWLIAAGTRIFFLGINRSAGKKSSEADSTKLFQGSA